MSLIDKSHLQQVVDKIKNRLGDFTKLNTGTIIGDIQEKASTAALNEVSANVEAANNKLTNFITTDGTVSEDTKVAIKNDVEEIELATEKELAAVQQDVNNVKNVIVVDEAITDDTKVAIKTSDTNSVELATEAELDAVSANVENATLIATAAKTEADGLTDDIANCVAKDVTVTPTELKEGAYEKSGAYHSSTVYYSSEKIPLNRIIIGSKIKLKASLSSSSDCVVLFDKVGNVLDYLSSSNAVERGYTETSKIQSVEIEAKSDSAYIVTVIRSAYYTSLDDMSVTYKMANYQIGDKTITGDKIADNTISEDNLTFKLTGVGKNKCDENSAVSGFIKNSNGLIGESSSYKTTDYIDISNFESKIVVSPKLRDLLQYDEDKNAIASSYISTATLNAVVDIADNAKYVRVSYFDSDSGSIQIEDGTETTDYEEYTIYIASGIQSINTKSATTVQEMIDSSIVNTDYLAGKKWCPFGDSFTDSTNKTLDSGVFSGKQATYPRLIATKTGISVDETYFKSGRTMAYPADGTFINSATCPTCDGYYQNLPSDVDYVTIMLGINDLNHENGTGTTSDGEDATGIITLGTIDDTDTSTYCGAYNTVLSWLRNNRPYAHVGIIITNGTRREDFTNAQIALAKKWGYPYLNLNGDERTPAFIRCYNPNLSDELKMIIMQSQAWDYPTNTHPNWQTHQLESTIIEAWLRSL